jgi:hypothetical protein
LKYAFESLARGEIFLDDCNEPKLRLRRVQEEIKFWGCLLPLILCSFALPFRNGNQNVKVYKTIIFLLCGNLYHILREPRGQGENEIQWNIKCRWFRSLSIKLIKGFSLLKVYTSLHASTNMVIIRFLKLWMRKLLCFCIVTWLLIYGLLCAHVYSRWRVVIPVVLCCVFFTNVGSLHVIFKAL